MRTASLLHRMRPQMRSSRLPHLGPDAAASVQDAGPWHNRLEEAPRWHIGQHPAVRRRRSRWPVDSTATRMREGKRSPVRTFAPVIIIGFTNFCRNCCQLYCHFQECTCWRCNERDKQTKWQCGLYTKKVRSKSPNKKWKLNIVETLPGNGHKSAHDWTSVDQSAYTFLNICSCQYIDLFTKRWKWQASQHIRLLLRWRSASLLSGGLPQMILVSLYFVECQHKLQLLQHKTRLEWTTALLRHLNVREIKRIFFAEETNIYLNLPE